MKKAPYILMLITMLFIGIMAGMLIERATNKSYVVLHSSDYTDSEPTATSNAQNETGKININTADVYYLSMLPGIGETIAQRIIDFRETNGLYCSIEDLLQVEGIGEKRLEEITPYITTGG